jgi:hypothetical protein
MSHRIDASTDTGRICHTLVDSNATDSGLFGRKKEIFFFITEGIFFEESIRKK